MIDFHTHILPEMDDGAASVTDSLDMLKTCMKQGVDTVFATSHFYADEDDPTSFLKRRQQSYDKLIDAMGEERSKYPVIFPAAEVLYFPGMSTAEELSKLTMGKLPCLMVEPPMIPWTNSIIDEIEQTGANLSVVPVIAHVDRYMRLLGDFSLIDMLDGRRVLTQFNASFFIFEKTRKIALDLLRRDRVQLLGSDCHNMTDRAPNIGLASKIIRDELGPQKLSELTKKSYRMVGYLK